jgi:hypothetical protein
MARTADRLGRVGVFHASQPIASGMDVLTISRRLGHGSTAITLTVYGHLIEGKDSQAADVMESTFASPANGMRTSRSANRVPIEVGRAKRPIMPG